MRPIPLLAVAFLAAACGPSDRPGAAADGEEAGPPVTAEWPLRIESVTEGDLLIDNVDAQKCEAFAFKSPHDNTVLQFSARSRTLRDNISEARCRGGYREGRAILHVQERWKVRLWCGIRGAVRVEDTNKEASSAMARIIVDAHLDVPGGKGLNVLCRIAQGPESGEFEVGTGIPPDTARQPQQPFWFDDGCLPPGRYTVTTNLVAWTSTGDDMADAESFQWSAIEIDPVERC